jgi:membrane protease YdiL (CAAX protease family)
LLTLIPAFSEELSWRGYLLPQLLQRYSVLKALLLHGAITWFWHIPFLLAVGADFGPDLIIGIAIVLLVSLVPAVMHAIVFAWFWSRSGSLWVATFYHAAFDEVRDSLQLTVGFGWIAENWQMLLLLVLGVILLLNNAWLAWLASQNKIT